MYIKRLAEGVEDRGVDRGFGREVALGRLRHDQVRNLNPATRLADNCSASVNPVPGESLQLDGRQGWIVTCGALYRGLCMTWTPGTGVVVSHRLAR